MESKWRIAILETLMVSAVIPVSADGPAAPPIGSFVRFGLVGDLTEDDAQSSDEGVNVTAPAMASSLRVNVDWLEARLGPWAALRAFELDPSGHAAFATDSVEFETFDLGPEPVFTSGSYESIRFLDRPMWVNATAHADGIRLDMEDGNPAGQAVFLSADWLASRGIHRPNITHEDGSFLPAVLTEDERGYLVDVPHFSFMIINPEGLVVQGRQAGVMTPHAGEAIWFPGNQTLYVNVSKKLTAYDVLVGSAWLYDKIPNPVSSRHDWSYETVSGTHYYLVTLTSADTPTRIVIGPGVWRNHTFAANLTAVADAVQLGASVIFPRWDGSNTSVVLEVAAYVNWTDIDKVGNQTNKTGLRLRESPSDRANGTLAFFFFDPLESLYGYICDIQGILYMSIAGGFGNSSNMEGPFNCDPPPTNYPYSPPAAAEQHDFYYRVFAEDNYASTYGALWAGKAVAAVEAPGTMWDYYTGNTHNLDFTLWILNLSQGSNCDALLDAFTYWVDANGYRGGQTVQSLITARNLGSCLGQAYGPLVGGNLAAKLDNLVVGRDVPAYGYFGATNDVHLGMVIAQETAHNLGETAHNCLVVNGETSIMCNDTQYERKRFWLHYGDASQSADRIIRATSAW